MNFDFESQHYEFRDAFKGFLDKSYPLDRHRRLIEGVGFDAELWNGLASLGLFGMLVPESYGGLELGFVDLALVLEELGAALVPPPVAETLIATDLLVRHGSAEQRQRYLPSIAAGELKVTVAASEADSSFEPLEITTAVDSAKGGTLTGRKIMVPQATIADLVVVTARLGPGGGAGVVLLERGRAGMRFAEHETLDLASRFHAVTFDGVKVAAGDIIAGAEAVSRLFDVGATAASLEMSGIAGRMLDMAVAYAETRVQFDKPIGSFQAIKHRCADVHVKVNSGRTAAYYASWAVAEDAPERAKAVSIAKSFCGDAARFACNEGIQIHGGMGFTWELGLHYYLRRAKVLEYSWGDAAMHRERVITATLAELRHGGGVT
jgi:alkylation response protein AidB-like acyl-CoA dehydrogenase